jgi:hypothetical protein
VKNKLKNKRIFYCRFLETLKKTHQKNKGFDTVSPDLKAFLLWVTNKSKNTKKFYCLACPVAI